MQTLKETKPGQIVRVTKIGGSGPVKRRIMEMGLTKGVEVHVRKVAPLGDPMEVTVRNYQLSLRKADAELIEVAVHSKAAAPPVLMGNVPVKTALAGKPPVDKGKRPVKIALAGNPNSGKTTLFNALTGSNQFVGNWPGVTVEKIEGRLKGYEDASVTDLPGIYSLSPYTPEEVVARNYLTDERPDVILNIVDATNLERNLFLTTQLTELGIPVVVALNMMDIVRKNGDRVDTARLAEELGCHVVEISALKGHGITVAADAAVAAADGVKTVPKHSFSGGVEHTLAHIEEAVLHSLPQERQRFFAVKLFERDRKIIEKLNLKPEQVAHIEQDIKRRETEMGDDSESIITADRYRYIDSIIEDCINIRNRGVLSASDKIDRVLTNRILALPIFALVMFIVYFVSVTTVGSIATDWANDGVFGDGWHLFGIGSSAYEESVAKFTDGLIAEEPDPSAFGVWIPGVPVFLGNMLKAVNCAEWLQSLIIDGIVAGVGAVLGFVPQMFILFMFLAFLEACGYMARIAFIMDRIFRRFGLSGKSFIPILIGTGCGVPGIMASRTIENDRDRKMTVITTTFIPCSAKLPIIALIAGALFDGAWWVAPSAYFAGIAAIVCSGIILKKTKAFAGDVAPFVMELPAYHWPTAVNIMRSMWERGWSFIKKAGTIVLLATIVVWFASDFGWGEGGFGMVDMGDSILARAGGIIAPLFAPLGWGNWQAAVAAITGLIAKENVVGTLGILYNAGDGAETWSGLQNSFGGLAAYSFLLFNLLCAPCAAAIGAIRREMNNARWFFGAIGYQCGLAYIVSLCVYQWGTLFSGRFGAGTVAAFLLTGGALYLLFRPAARK
ncbi:MAG: 50S ribosome-binding GTPase [Chitinispirillales bacterium]|jgi:ferrous iron transport protein B|nr:50S ribosome-binding GTPase [Chitinispirillales bacterium]